MMARFFGVAILGLVLLGPVGESVRGQDATLAESYGRGVQAYFNGEYEKSVELLSKAISLKSPDPRCHFFRGLAHAKLGKQEEAAADFKNGGDLEALDVGENYPVARALIRIQGLVRLEIEASRRQAKVDLKALQEERRRVRFEERVINEKAAVRKTPEEGAQIVEANEEILVALPTLPTDATRNLTNPFNTPVEQLSSSDLLGGANSRPSTGNPITSQPVAAAGNSPFAKPAVAEPTATAGNTPPAGSDPDDPFAVKPSAGGGPAKPAAGGDAADPFAPKPAAGGDVADPFAPKPAADNASGEAPKKGLFGSLFRAVGAGVTKSVGGDEAAVDGADPKPDDAPVNPADPFGDAKPAEEPAKPAAKPADPFGGNDPFGGGAKPADKPAKPAAKPADPFGGGAKPAAKPVDPFGGGAKPADKPVDPFGGGAKPAAKPVDPFGGGAKPADKPAKPAAKPADPFGGNDPFKP